MNAEHAPGPAKNPEKRDWLDAALKNHLVDDDGFGDRVIAIGRAQRRNRLLLRLLSLVLVTGFVVAGVGVVVGQAGERWGWPDEAGARRLAAESALFARELARFDAVPALARKSGRDAGPVLDVVERELLARDGARAACHDAIAFAGIGAARAPDEQGRAVVDDSCDTGFLVGLAGYDEWRRVRPLDFSAESADRDFPQLARAHLRRARAVGADAYAAAARDVEALGRLLYGHGPSGGEVFRALLDETLAAEAEGRSGGYTAPLRDADIRMANRLWMAAPDYAGTAGSEADFAAVEAAKSVLVCGARGDTFGTLALQELFSDGARSARLAPDGCAPRATGQGSWVLFADTPTTSARLRGALLELPLLRRIGAWFAGITMAPSIEEGLKAKKGDR